MFTRILKILLIIFVLQFGIFAQGKNEVDSNSILKNKLSLQTLKIPIWLNTERHNFNNPDPLATEVDYTILAGVGVITLGIGTVIHNVQSVWWQQQDAKFKFQEDWEYALWIDKVGHFYGTHLLGHAFSSGFEAANIQAEKATIYAAIAAFAFEMYVEIYDGFGPNWGFSPGDALFDFLGAAYFTSQYYFPYLKNFQPRVSYWPSEEQRAGLRKDHNIIDDYNGQKYWLSVRMKEVLPKNIAKFWPSFLMLSVGMGVKDFQNKEKQRTSELYLSFDLDIETLPLHGKFWQFVKNTLNYVHFPMPGVRIAPDAAFFVFTY